jgi:high affinity sulfate transporter 1
MALVRPKEKNLLQRYVPIVDWLPSYNWREDVRWDFVAGLTVWALLVPEAMAYAGIAGVPPEAGLYAAPLALLGYAIFGTSKHLFVGPSSTVAIVSASVVAGLAVGGTDEFWWTTSWLAIVVGVLFIVFGVIRMGWVANFMAQPVLDGFIVGLAITIAVGQLDKMFGIDAEGDNTVQEFFDIVFNVSEWDWPTIIVGFVSLALLFLMHRFTPQIPAALTVVILAIAVSAAFSFEDHGIHVVGDIPAGLPDLGFPQWPEGLRLSELIIGALAVILVGYAESLAAAKEYARKNGYQVDPNQELIGYGAANFGAGISQGFVVDGSLSKTAAGAGAGQRTQMTGIIAALITVITILFLTGLFFHLPEATLGAIVIHAVWKLIEFKGFRRMWRVRKADFYAAAAAFIGVLLLDVLGGIVIGIVLSLLILIYRASFPGGAELGMTEEAGFTVFVDVDRNPEAERPRNAVIFRFHQDLLFSNANAFADQAKELLYRRTDPPARVLIVDCEQMSDMDMTGAAALVQLTKELGDAEVEVWLARLHGEAYDTAERAGVFDAVGVANVHVSLRAAADAYADSHDGEG